MIDEVLLRDFYENKHLSMKEIADKLGCSVNKIVYHMNKLHIERRSISDAIYQKHNPNGDPFRLRAPETTAEFELYGLGIGLFWGEGNKANKYSVRLGNTDPELLKTFIRFLTDLCGVASEDLRFGLQIFSDIDKERALSFWVHALDVKASQFYKITVTISGSIGTYRKKSEYGVVTVFYNNKKLRDILVNMLPR